MSNQADIRDIQILGDLKLACGRFGEDVLRIVASLQKQFEEIQEWLEERKRYWGHEVDKARDELREARRDLHRCERQADQDEGYVDCNSEQERVSDIEKHLAECEDNWETVKKWQHQIESQIADFNNDIHRLSHLASTRTGSAQAFLADKIEILNRYIGGVSSAVGISGLHGRSGNDNIKSGFVGKSQTALTALSADRKNPVSLALLLEVSGSLHVQVNDAIKAIDEVHDDGKLQPVPIRRLIPNNHEETFGYLQPRLSPMENGKIVLSVDHIAVWENGPWPEFTTLHETGHLLDLEVLGEKGIFASKTGHPVIKSVLDTAKQSEAVKGLQNKLTMATDRSARKHIRYLLTESEIWARAYAQFIAERSKSETLKSQLNGALSKYEFRQWSKADFAPIDVAIETMFKKLNWL